MSVVLAVLQSSSRDSDSFQKSLTVLMVSAREKTASRALVSAGAVGTISTLMDSGGVNGIKAAIILSFLLGNDKSGGTQLSLLESKPQLLDLLESIFNNIMNGLDGDGYEFGNFDLIVIVAAIASIAVSDKNKAILLQKPTILRGLFQVLSLFLDDAPRIPYRGTAPSRGGVGGGGQDIESAESAIKALQLLSFFYKNDSDLCQQHTAIMDNVFSMLKRLASHPKLAADAQQSAQYLCTRLGSSKKSSFNSSTTTDSSHKLSTEPATPVSPSSTASEFIPMKSIQPGQLRAILENLKISQLIAPFENNHVDGTLLDVVESSDDIVDIDRNLIRGIYAKKFFNFVKAWKEDGGRIPRSLLIPSQQSPSTPTVDTTITPTKISSEEGFPATTTHHDTVILRSYRKPNRNRS
eukprot:gene37255-48704_t